MTERSIELEGLKPEELIAIKKEYLRQHEVACEQARLNYIVAQKALEAIKKELEGK